MTKRKTEAERILTKLSRSEWRLGLPQCQKRSDSEIGIWRERRALGISCAISNDDSKFEDAVTARKAAEVEYFGEYARRTA